MRRALIGFLLGAALPVVAAPPFTAAYPSGVKTFTTKVIGDTIQPAHINDLQDEVTAIEGGLINGLAHSLLPSVDSTYNLGSNAVRWATIYADNVTVPAITSGGTLTISGTTVGTFSGSGAALTSLAETAITDGAILARVAANETVSGTWTFTATQFLSSTNPILAFSETDQGTDLKNWVFSVTGAEFQLQTRTDAVGALATPISVDRSGNIEILGGISERERAFFIGATQTRAFSGGNFTDTGAGSWTVESGDVTNESWSVVGDTMYYRVNLNTTTISSTVTILHIAIPGGFTAQETTNAVGLEVDNATTQYSPVCTVTASGTTVNVLFATGASFPTGTNNQTVSCQLIFKVS